METIFSNTNNNQQNNQFGNRGRGFKVREDDDDDMRGNRKESDDDWTNVRGSMADTDKRGKNDIESKIKEEDNDEFMSQTEDRKQKKTFLNKILRSIEDDNKEGLIVKENESKNDSVKKSGFGSKFEDNDDEDWGKSKISSNPLNVISDKPKARGFGSRFDDNDIDEPKKNDIIDKPKPKRGFGSRFNDDDEPKPMTNIINKQEIIKPIPEVKTKPASKGFASRFKDDDDEEEDRPKAFIGKLKTVTDEVKHVSNTDNNKLNFKNKNKIIEEDFSDENDEKNNNSND